MKTPFQRPCMEVHAPGWAPAQTEYKKRHDVVGRVIHWELCKEYEVECSDKWYEHSPKSIKENEEVKLLWDFTIQTDREIHHRRPDIVIQKKGALGSVSKELAGHLEQQGRNKNDAIVGTPRIGTYPQKSAGSLRSRDET